MINFRYHLVSVVAVLLALSIGIIVGSGFLGGPLRRQIDRELDQLASTNSRLQSQISDRNRVIDQLQAFAGATEQRLLRSELVGEEVVVFSLDGTDGGMIDGLRAAVEEAGGGIALTVTALDKLGLETPEARAELGAILGSEELSAEELRRETAAVLGAQAAAAGDTTPPTRLVETPDQRFEGLVEELAGADYLALDELQEGDAVPSNALFLVAAGSADDPPYAPRDFITALAVALSRRGAGVLVAEPSESAWEAVAAIRDDSIASDRVSTVDQAETLAGRITTALALAQAEPGHAGHYGFGPGTTVLPEPTPPTG